jgi:hypothetical protein
MNGDRTTPVTRDALLETFAAELTVAAYRVALRSRTRGTWLDLELELWRALSDMVKTRGRELYGPAAVTHRPPLLEQSGRTDGKHLYQTEPRK